MKKCCLNCYWYEESDQVCLWGLLAHNGPKISVLLPERETSCSEYEDATKQ